VNKQKLLHILENESVVTKFSPFEAYTLVLKNMVETQVKNDIKDYIKTLLVEKGYTDYKYQTDAASQAISIIENYSGVIIADVVGLGKSVIAGIIAKQLGKRGIVICPPNLIGNKKSG
jgi:superfamily II DNA or RNA helicase